MLNPPMHALPDYVAAIRYIEDLAARPILPWQEAELRRARVLLAALGDPQRRFATIQVAGTAGKGSTTTMAAAILHGAGYTTGAFTSPHLQSYRERIAVDGLPVDRKTWVEATRRVAPVVERMETNTLLQGYTLGRPAFLEVLWAMAALIFVDSAVRCAVVETGVGGRIDPTTVNAASVAVITNVSLDHMERLGRTVEAIATEKAGLIKPGQIVVSAAEGDALAVIRAVCAERGATLWHARRFGHDETIAQPESTVALISGPAPDAPFTISTPLGRYSDLRLRMEGAHQGLNAACAVAVVDALAAQERLHVPAEAVRVGLTAAIPGRIELIEGSPQILLDGAKGPAAAAALARALDTIYAGRRIVLLLGMLSHKDIPTMVGALAPRAGAVVVTEPPWEARAGVAHAVAAQARARTAAVELIPEVSAAFARARALAGPDDLVVVAGSLILVGAVRELLLPMGDLDHDR